ncbi:MAG: diaminopropionate ammonia-lyase [Rhodobacterales bacterium]|nr:diaminopropionate ammonia-lyase [Rhodobacterales bacterium]|tara:strand:- start:1206 stop:2348 length:1143 start_codon:yes stop_codon:yes gene_type:complete
MNASEDFKWKLSNYIYNKNYNFDRKKILDICDENNVIDAYKTISGWKGYEPTPLISLHKLSRKLKLNNIFYKDESKRFHLKSFKALGGAYAVEKATIDNKNLTVTTATAGNHGRSVAWGAQRLGLNCKIFISEYVSEARANSMRNLDAEVIRVNGNYEKSLEECVTQANKNGWEIIQDVAWENYETVPKLTMAGYSVMIKEISNQTNQYITHVFLQAGVGGMASGAIAGIAKYFKRIPKIIIVEPENADCVLKSIDKGSLQKVDIKKESIMGGMSCGEVSLVPWKILKESVDICTSISDVNVDLTISMLKNKILSDEEIVGGECSTPGIISLIACSEDSEIKKNLGLEESSNILVIGCEGDADENLYNKLLSTGNKKLLK